MSSFSPFDCEWCEIEYIFNADNPLFFFVEDVFSGSYANSNYLWSPVFPASLSMPCARSRHSVCVWDGGLFVYGGRGTRGTLKDFWRYDIGTFFGWRGWGGDVGGYSI